MSSTSEYRKKLVADVMDNLSPWVNEDESSRVMLGIGYVATDKLVKMNRFLQDKETTCRQKALLAKSLLTKGYIHFMQKKLSRGIAIQSLLCLATIGTLGSALYNIEKRDNRQLFFSLFTGFSASVISDQNRRKFLDETLDARSFIEILSRDKEEQKRIDAELKKWLGRSF